MANGPDFTVKTKSLDAGVVADVLQRKRQIENEQNQSSLNTFNDRMKRITDAITAGQTVASNMMALAEKRNQIAGTKELTGLLQQPTPQPPAPIASSSALPEAGSFPVQPSPEENAAYQDKIQVRNAALLAALVKANPKEVTQEFAKTQFAQPAKPDFQAKTVLYNGIPTEAGFDPRNNRFVDVQTQQPLTGKIEPYNSLNTPTDVTDEDRKRLTPLAKAVVEGRALPAALVNARGTDKVKLSQIAAELDPQFDLSLAPQRIAVRKDFASAGRSGQALTSLNTVIGHLDTLDGKINALDNKQIAKLNSVVNYVKSNIGRPEVSGFLAAKSLVNAELAKVAQGSGVVTNEERKEFSTALDSASSPDQAHEVILTWMDLMKSRVDSMKSNWSQTMGDMEPPTPFINEKSKAKLIKHGYDPKTLEKVQSASGSSRPPLDSFFK